MIMISLDLTEAIVVGVLRAALSAMLPAGIEVIRAEVNRVPEPKGENFVLMTPTARVRLASNASFWRDGAFDPTPVDGTRTDRQPTQITVQLDVHGPNSANAVQIITTLFRSDVAFDAFAATGFDVRPLYAADPNQSPFTNAEQQLEYRWTVDVVLQANITVSTTQDFAAALEIGLIDVP